MVEDLNRRYGRYLTVRMVYPDAAPSVATPASSLLPRGIGTGKVAALVAGIGLVAGAGYWLSRSRDEPAGRWAERIEAERARADAHTR